MTLDLDRKKEFVIAAIENAFMVQCQSKYKGGTAQREIDPDLSIQFFIDNLSAMKIDAIDRVIYHQGAIPEDVLGNHAYEINVTNTVDYWKLLYIYVNRNNFYKLIGKFNLKLIEW